jgi:6-phosphogluconolactonase
VTRLVDVQSHRSPVHVVLTGGTVGIATLAALAHSPARDAVDWSEVHLWWGDERFVPAGDGDRNETQAREALLDALGDALPAANVHPVPAQDDDVADPHVAADAYAGELAAHAPAGAEVPQFDVLLLGMGPDGHVASLFPGHEALRAAGRPTVGVEGSPKPPPLRVSLTFGPSTRPERSGSSRRVPRRRRPSPARWPTTPTRPPPVCTAPSARCGSSTRPRPRRSPRPTRRPTDREGTA